MNQTNDIRQFNGAVSSMRPPVMAVMAGHCLIAITDGGTRPYVATDKALLASMGLDPEDDGNLRQLQRGLRWLRENGLIETYRRRAGRGRGTRRILAMTFQNDSDLFPDRIRAGLDRVTWPQIRKALFRDGGGFNSNWKETLAELGEGGIIQTSAPSLQVAEGETIRPATVPVESSIQPSRPEVAVARSIQKEKEAEVLGVEIGPGSEKDRGGQPQPGVIRNNIENLLFLNRKLNDPDREKRIKFENKYGLPVPATWKECEKIIVEFYDIKIKNYLDIREVLEREVKREFELYLPLWRGENDKRTNHLGG